MREPFEAELRIQVPALIGRSKGQTCEVDVTTPCEGNTGINTDRQNCEPAL
jgi:hypothetical protein